MMKSGTSMSYPTGYQNAILRWARRHSGAEAFQVLRQKDFDVAVLDLKMEDMDGIEISENIKKNGAGTCRHHAHRPRFGRSCSWRALNKALMIT